MSILERTVALWRRVTGLNALRVAENGTVALADDRRLWDRFPSDIEVKCQAVGAGGAAPLDARVRNVSHGGVSLIVPRQFHPGELLSLKIPQYDEQTTTTVLACVVHVDAQGPSEWALGCRFSGELSDDELAGFGARRSRGGVNDKRVWKRYDCSVQATIETVAESQPLKETVVVQNISATGIALRVAHPIEVGTVFSLDLQKKAGQTMTVLSCAVHVVETADEWTVGCNFIRALSDEELDALT